MAQFPSNRGRVRVGLVFSPSKDRLSWIIASRFAVVHSICLRKLTFTLLRVTSAFLLFVQSAYAKSASSSLKFIFQLTSNLHELVLLGKCLGFAPRSESFAIEPSVQVCSISSLSEFRFAQYVRKSAMPNLQKFTPDQNGQ